MATRIPSRRLGQSALAALHPRSRWVLSTSLPSLATRNASSKEEPGRKTSERPKKDVDLSNPILEEYLKRREIENGFQPDAQDQQNRQQPVRREGSMSKSPTSLFLPVRELPGYHPGLPRSEREALKQAAEDRKAAAKAADEKTLSAMTLDPFPEGRRKIERQMVIRGVKRRGRLTKAQNIARTERQSLFKSQDLPTSVKKLQKVINQIAGKTVSDALIQLRFSPKRVARDVIKGLEIAQNEAIAARGMGLGSGELSQHLWEMQRAGRDIGSADTLKATRKKLGIKATTVELKDGTKKLVRDPTEIFIEQAWVGKGEMWKTPEYRARGMVNLLRHRTTSFSVLLKEEKTRMRISEEIKKKRANRKLWTALPDRPVTAQRQYCLW